MPRTALALVFVFLTACVTVPAARVEPVIADRLFCGLSIPGGGSVSDEQWSAFVREVVTPRFPDGLTIWRAEGQWRGRDGVIAQESVMIIEVFHAPGSRYDREVTAIAEEYRRRFQQESVMRVTMPAGVEFVD
jgi:hypothetical protein